jgi:hypothetical protein
MEQLFFQLLGDFKIAAWLIAFNDGQSDDKIFIATEIIFTITYVALSHICVDYFKLKELLLLCNKLFYLFRFYGFIFRKLLFNYKENRKWLIQNLKLSLFFVREQLEVPKL